VNEPLSLKLVGIRTVSEIMRDGTEFRPPPPNTTDEKIACQLDKDPLFWPDKGIILYLIEGDRNATRGFEEKSLARKKVLMRLRCQKMEGMNFLKKLIAGIIF
jgi:hypothetical protein